MLDLAAQPAVRARFGFDDDELERVGDWVRRAGVRWGLDAAHRAPYHLDGVAQNTWQTGLDRVLVGVTMDEEELRTVGLALPLDDVDSNEADLAGRFAELVDRLALPSRRCAAAVAGRLGGHAGDRRRRPDLDPSLRRVADRRVRRELTDVLTSAGDGASAALLGLADVRALLARRLRGRPTRANFRTGQLTMCTMVPMRSVPHRVVCLLGVNDGVFPRGTHADGDDVLGRSPAGGRARRPLRGPAAVPRRGARRARDAGHALHRRRRAHGGGPAARRTAGGAARRGGPDGPGGGVLVRHPLQPFDARNFVDGDLGAPGPFSFDAASYDGARALRGPRQAATAFLDRPLPPVADGDVVELDDLVRFLEAPVKTFLRQRLGLSTFSEDDDPAEAVPIELDHLERYHVGDRLLEHRLAGVPAARWCAPSGCAATCRQARSGRAS